MGTALDAATLEATGQPETLSTYFPPQQTNPHSPELADVSPERHWSAPALNGATCAAREPAAWTLPVEAVERVLTPAWPADCAGCSGVMAQAVRWSAW